MKNTFIKMTLLLSAFATVGLAEAITIRVPFEFSAAGKMLPAGEYTFQEETSGVLIVTGSTPNSSMLMLTRGGTTEPGAKPGVTFSGSHSLSCIQMSEGKRLEIISPTSTK